MTETEAQLTAEEKAALAGLNLDATWEDPKQSFPGIVVASEIRFASDEYKAATEFRPAITELLPQWDYRVRRLDAQRQELDGSITDEVIYYAGHDLKKFNARANDGQGGLVPLSSRYPKEWFITTANKKVFGTIHPPEKLVGKMAMWDYYRDKAFGTVSAKRVLVPASILAPDYEFTGEKVTFQAREREDGAEASADGVAQADASSNGMLSLEEAKAIVPGLIVGIKRDDPASLIAALPREAKHSDVLSGLATQDLLKEFVEAGSIVIAEDGVIGAGAAS